MCTAPPGQCPGASEPSKGTDVDPVKLWSMEAKILASLQSSHAGRPPNRSRDQFLKQLAQELARERYEERAAILEYDAGVGREEAERLAREPWRVK